MKTSFHFAGIVGAALCLGSVNSRLDAAPALTVYNQNFAVVRESVPLDLKAGINSVQFSGTTAHLEPDSVILRDSTGRRQLRIMEQNFRADPVSQGLLLNYYEGKTIRFQIQRGEQVEIVSGKIIRSGYVPHTAAFNRYGQPYAAAQTAYASYAGAGQPIIEVNRQLQFGLPGQPLFPSLTDETVLKPTLHWLLQTDQPGRWDAELSYVTGGMSWEADYNAVSEEQGDQLELVGWVTVDNQSGKTFENARIKLMAGDLSKIQPEQDTAYARRYGLAGEGAQPVTEKTFDEYHLYTLERAATLRDRETKQVEFVRASGVQSHRFYVYDGVRLGNQPYVLTSDHIRQEPGYGVQSNPKVWVMREFSNTKTNQLGIPLPKGRVRFYRRETGGALEFTGENQIDHTPQGENVRVYTGNAFDLVGERVRTSFEINHNERWVREQFEIGVRNRKKEPVEVRFVEHLYRWITWEITAKSDAFTKTDSQTIEFRVPVKPDEERKVTYTVMYRW